MPAFQNSGKQIKEPSEFLANGIYKTVKLLPSAPRAFYRTLIIKIAEKVLAATNDQKTQPA